MTRRAYAGGAVSTTTTGAINSTDLSVTIASATGWPSGANEFFATLERGGANEERVLCTRSGTTLTFASTAKRGVDGTTAASHASGVAIEHTFSGVDADEANEHVNATGAVHAGASMSPGTLVFPGATVPAQTAEGSAVWDTDNDLLTVGTGAARKTLVDTDTAQTLASKTLTAPTIADFTNAQHDHGDADDGGGISLTGIATSTWAPTIGGTGWALGNGTITGRYVQVGKFTFYRIEWDFGTTSTAGTGQLTLSTPVAASASHFLVTAGQGEYQGAITTGFLSARIRTDLDASLLRVLGQVNSDGTSTPVVPINFTSTQMGSVDSGSFVVLAGMFEAA